MRRWKKILKNKKLQNKFFFPIIKMLEVTRKNCFKCDLGTIIDNDSQYFWINLKDFEVEKVSGWIYLMSMVIHQL